MPPCTRGLTRPGWWRRRGPSRTWRPRSRPWPRRGRPAPAGGARAGRPGAGGVREAGARRQRIHASRHLRAWTDAEGAWHLHLRHNPEVGARVMAALGPVRDRLFRTARAEGHREPPEAYAADALVEV